MSAYDQSRAQAHLRRFKNNYVINNNGARNAALRDGKTRAKWVLPWDGNCFLTERAWSEIVTQVRARPYLKYFTVPMARTTDNAALLDPPSTRTGFRAADPVPLATAVRHSTRRITTAAGPRWSFSTASASPAAGTVSATTYGIFRARICPKMPALWAKPGWVARLYSGQGALETEGQSIIRARGEARIAA
jgi:hypothetical protein